MRPKETVFVSYDVMFKLTDYLPGASDDKGPRELECVNCGFRLKWAIYTLAPEKFDAQCSECGMPASHYWKDRLHRKVSNARTS